MDDEAPATTNQSLPKIAKGTTTFVGEERWQSNGNNFWAANLTMDAVPPGLYRSTAIPNIGVCLEKMVSSVDELVSFPDSPSDLVIAEIVHFWKLSAEFKKRGFLHKRGVLLWGSPGSGKTSTIQQLIKIVVRKHEGLAIFLDHPEVATTALQMVRRIEPHRPIIALMEDVDAMIRRHGEASYLAMLDGESQVDNIVYIATTNYPELLDPRFTDRPSRFDLVCKIDMPPRIARYTFLKVKEPSFDEATLNRWADATDGLSLAHLREMLILCCCFKYPFEKALARMTEMRERSADSKDAEDHDDVGFHRRKKSR